jgi:hypothetical protein
MEKHDWDDDGSFICEWLQVNWEFLIERELLEKNGFLKSYTYDNFRITHPNAIPTHEIICKPKANKQLIDDKTKAIIPAEKTLGFAGFKRKLERGYGFYPPFDFLTAFTQDRKYFYLFFVPDVEFIMRPIDI